MTWKKYIHFDMHKNMEYLLIGIVLISIISFIFKRPLLFIIVGLFIIYVVINELYNRSIGKKLQLQNDRTTIHAFPNENVEMTLLFTNHSYIPYINGHLQLSINDVVTTKVHEYVTSGQRSLIKIPASIMGKRKTRAIIPLEANKRGVARVYHLTYKFPHLMNFDHVELTYEPYIYSEIVIFPELKTVRGIEQLLHHLPGDQRIRFSPYEDIQSLIGTREYVSSDPFHRINWNATVKTGELQTNEYERVIDRSFFFIVNIEVENFELSVMEDVLSYTAFIANDVHEQKLPYEMAINARKFGAVPFVYQKQGEGNAHYLQTLDMLARIDRHGVTSRITQVIVSLREELARAHTVVYIGLLSREEHALLQQIVGEHKQVLHVNEEGNVQPLAKGVMSDAT